MFNKFGECNYKDNFKLDTDLDRHLVHCYFNLNNTKFQGDDVKTHWFIHTTKINKLHYKYGLMRNYDA